METIAKEPKQEKKTKKDKKATRILTKKERIVFHKAFIIDKIPMEERIRMCEKIGIPYKNAYMSTYNYNVRNKSLRKANKVKEKGEVEVTNFTKPHPLLLKATIKVGNAQVEIPGRSISIDGVLLEW